MGSLQPAGGPNAHGIQQPHGNPNNPQGGAFPPPLPEDGGRPTENNPPPPK